MEKNMQWRYYNHALLPTCAPHEMADTSALTDASLWTANSGAVFFARWTTDFDCGYETNWWYEIKDTPFEMSQLKAKRRYILRQGAKYFEVCRIDPAEYARELYDVQRVAFSVYPKSYRPAVDKEAFQSGLATSDGIFYGAFFRETGRLCGYTQILDYGSYVGLNVQKTDPAYEKYQVNAALLEQVLTDLSDRLAAGCYICDGERNIMHETAFQDYLEKYFGFRKAYCRLNIRYRFMVGLAVKLLYPFRAGIEAMNSKSAKQIAAVLKMENILRSDRASE